MVQWHRVSSSSSESEAAVHGVEGAQTQTPVWANTEQATQTPAQQQQQQEQQRLLDSATQTHARQVAEAGTCTHGPAGEALPSCATQTAAPALCTSSTVGARGGMVGAWGIQQFWAGGGMANDSPMTHVT